MQTPGPGRTLCKGAMVAWARVVQNRLRWAWQMAPQDAPSAVREQRCKATLRDRGAGFITR